MEDYQTDLHRLAQTERQLATRVQRICDQLNRMDGFDEEQRAELYTILQALKHESQFSAEQIESLVSGGEPKHV